MKWIDVVSPTLRKLHQTWVGFRGNRLMAHVNEYNRFVGHAAADMSLCVLFPGDGSSPVIKHAGDAIRRQVLPNVWAGLRFEDITSTLNRTQLATPFHAVANARQPNSRFGQWRSSEGIQAYEQLLLPFDNDQLRVCVVHAVYDLGRLQRLAA